MKIKELVAELNRLIPFAQAENFDNVGLLCGNPEREVTGVLISHDTLEHIVDEAIEKNTNVILSFHPIIFSGLKSITGKNYVERSVMKALENKIAIIAIHTALDNDFMGVNHRIGKELGLKNLKTLMPKNHDLQQLSVYVPKDYEEKVKEALFSAGAGSIGFYNECSFNIKGTGTFKPQEGSQPFIGQQGTRESVEETLISVIFEKYKKNAIISAMKTAHPYEEVAYQIYNLENENQYLGLGQYGEFETEISEEAFLNLVKKTFGLQVIRHSQKLNKPIRKVAMLGGSGADGIKAALANRCDAYLTADLKYHDFFQAENQLLLCDIGHFESEQFIIQQLFELLSENFTKFATLKTTQSTNPVNYFI
ncbi:Nif3-like dinuclear metal center hexameric protein [Riemerella anatipestifer]|uniref:GTP cyclohydrolase 1 type 2 homolog n=1 Tax=Riemerella anatipestifer (strain ATCC 11845 / DSM 15868 / JCM 9532 / NCTC 11014) TaxID=693978 RepID=E4T989_RIEAD|nr:Nif3-like dinuclear metal center hexameric protein [Riemerella anatipestifer]ADQ81570.1 protein of unknown function DUF34 [Riemerella anatipestifer ATCC 11845 = DSM 15868]ADZ12935.1 Uncharacterized protein conserved in bacteria [Riemerella anatipestifer RA-GD]AFD55589.1 hypothetical protein RA0C_0618 [Riemerella anatipestifer ATCC 11845 = DSM 15868]AGC40523.1 hypothetical protein G148_1219 [Riemerella anatipestifer RA-CH-2]AKP70695.1 hypothetical protein CG09_0429 [Riemerella anatipestifer]